MAIANGAQQNLHYKAETTYGATIAGEYLQFPFTGTSLALTKDGIESERLRGNRQVDDFRHGNKSVSGDISAELEYGSFDEIIQAVLCGTWTTNVLKAGVIRRSFAIEREFADLATDEYHLYKGCEFNSLALSVAPNAMIGATFGVIGQNLVLGTSKAGTYDADPTDFTPFDSFTGAIKEGGVASGDVIGTVTSIDLTIENGLEPLFSVGSQTTTQPSIGKSRVTGSLTTYYDSKALYEKFVNETGSVIELTLTDTAASANSYKILLPNIKYNSGQPDVSGEGPITVSMDFVALYDSTEDSQITITRIPG
tara:strand:- start:55 stop:984 length:930 start_codon:yes stop_codon:yes gene_type:complete